MERKKKIRRAFILIFAFYVIINIFIFGLMTAYMKTNNILSRNKLVMASVTENSETKNIKILDKSFVIDKNNSIKSISEICIYALIPEKIRVCTDVVLTFKDILLK